MRADLVAFASLTLALASACGGSYGSLGMAEDGSGTGSGEEGTGEGGEPLPDVPPESACQAQSLSVDFEVTVDEGPDSFGDAIAFEGDEILVGSIANGGPALTKLAGEGGLIWKKAWPEYEGEVVHIDLEESGASALFAGLPDGNLTALFDADGELVFERMIPETGYDFHPAGVDVYYGDIGGVPFEPGPESLQVRRAAWRTYVDEPTVGLLDNWVDGGADLWDIVIQKSEPVRIEDYAIGPPLDCGGCPEDMMFRDQITVGTVGSAPWVASHSVDGGLNFEAVIDAGAPAALTSVAIGPADTAMLGGVCNAGGQRWGWLARTDVTGAGLENATGACATWAALDLPPVADLTVTDDGVTITLSDDFDGLALVPPNQPPELVSLSALLGHDVSPRAVASAGACDFVVTGRVDSDGSSFVARLSGG